VAKDRYNLTQPEIFEGARSSECTAKAVTVAVCRRHRAMGDWGAGRLTGAVCGGTSAAHDSPATATMQPHATHSSF